MEINNQNLVQIFTCDYLQKMKNLVFVSAPFRNSIFKKLSMCIILLAFISRGEVFSQRTAEESQPESTPTAVETFTIEINQAADMTFKVRVNDILKITHDALESIQEVRIISDARIAFETGPQVIPEIGLSGASFGDLPRIKVVVDVSRMGWMDSLRAYLPSVLAHELCHIVRVRHFVSTVDPSVPLPPERESEAKAIFQGWLKGRPPTLGDFIIHEGFADHFAIEVTGRKPYPWDKALKVEQLEYWTKYALEHWDDEEYDIRAWVRGSDEIPPQTVYSIGYRLVSDYLESHPGIRPSDIMLESAETFRTKNRELHERATSHRR